MSESNHAGVPEPTAGQILAFHADGRGGLHATPVTGCSECLLDRIPYASDEELNDLLETQLSPPER
jgi:hypothetical protein